MKVEGGDEVPADRDPGVVGDDLVAYRLDRLGVSLHPAHLDNTQYMVTLLHLCDYNPTPPCIQGHFRDGQTQRIFQIRAHHLWCRVFLGTLHHKATQ